MAGYDRPDFWTLKAKKEGYPARSVYKLEEIIKKFGLLKLSGGASGPAVLDIGAAPGSWSLWILRQLKGAGSLTAVDIQDLGISPADANFHFSRAAFSMKRCGKIFVMPAPTTLLYRTPRLLQPATAS